MKINGIDAGTLSAQDGVKRTVQDTAIGSLGTTTSRSLNMAAIHWSNKLFSTSERTNLLNFYANLYELPIASATWWKTTNYLIAEPETRTLVDALVLTGDMTSIKMDALYGLTLDEVWKRIDKYVARGIEVGWWAKFVQVLLFIGGTSATHSVNGKNPSVNDIDFFNDVAGDHTSGGWFPNGTTSFADINIAPDSLENDMTISVYSRTDNSDSSREMMGAFQSATQRNDLILRSSGSTFAHNYTTTDRISLAVADSLGEFTSVIRASNDKELYKRGVSIGTDANASGTAPTINMFLGALNNIGSAGFFDNRQISNSYVASGLSSAEVLDHSEASQILQTDFSRQV